MPALTAASATKDRQFGHQHQRLSTMEETQSTTQEVTTQEVTTKKVTTKQPAAPPTIEKVTKKRTKDPKKVATGRALPKRGDRKKGKKNVKKKQQKREWIIRKEEEKKKEEEKNVEDV